jgi:hypothetical protein
MLMPSGKRKEEQNEKDGLLKAFRNATQDIKKGPKAQVNLKDTLK